MCSSLSPSPTFSQNLEGVQNILSSLTNRSGDDAFPHSMHYLITVNFAISNPLSLWNFATHLFLKSRLSEGPAFSTWVGPLQQENNELHSLSEKDSTQSANYGFHEFQALEKIKEIFDRTPETAQHDQRRSYINFQQQFSPRTRPWQSARPSSN